MSLCSKRTRTGSGTSCANDFLPNGTLGYRARGSNERDARAWRPTDRSDVIHRRRLVVCPDYRASTRGTMVGSAMPSLSINPLRRPVCGLERGLD